tara:strand:- start:565 stop:771 length:207 start_codon:yes stop_codon:yes gene_type:complete
MSEDTKKTTIECNKNNLTYSVNSDYICVVVNGQAYRRDTSVNELLGISLESLKSAIQRKRMEELNDES